MTIEAHLKAFLGEQCFALAARMAEVDALKEENAVLRAQLAEQQRNIPEVTGQPAPLHLVNQEPTG